MAETVLRVEHVGMRFNLSKERVDSLKDYILKSITRQMKFDEFWALKDINFTLEKGERIGILGTNGAGKTTSIRMMLGMLSRDSGTVTWNGKPLDINTCNVGYLAEERGLYPKYTIMDQLMYFAALRGVSASEAKKRIH